DCDSTTSVAKRTVTGFRMRLFGANQCARLLFPAVRRAGRSPPELGSGLKDAKVFIASKYWVASHEGKSLSGCLGDEHAIERVAVNQRQRRSRGRMVQCDFEQRYPRFA